jgi:CHAD domain-containing protein
MDVSRNTFTLPVKGGGGLSADADVVVSEAHPESLNQAEDLSSGRFAQELIQHQIRRLGKLQADVLADRDLEPLHQMRVSLRRLRTALGQFAPALELPDGVTVRRIAAVARRSSLCRDLDVLLLRLADDLMPRLPEEEQRGLHVLIKRIARERAQAFEAMAESLRSSRYLKLLASLNKWQKRPRLTALGSLPLTDWLYEWQEPFTSGLFLHPGWMSDDPLADDVHALRKRIKGARYSLEALERWCSPALQQWINDLRQAQDHLGDLHDLQILGQIIAKQESLKKKQSLPILMAEVEAAQRVHWLQWRELAGRLGQASSRQALRRELVELGS